MDSLTPSTQWREIIADDEAARHERYAAQFRQMQKKYNDQHGTGRALHRKQLFVARAAFTVLPKLPDFAAHGLFSKGASYPAWIRLSNGSPSRSSDIRPDVRGFSFAVQGLHGCGALGNGPTLTQAFALINQPKFLFAKSDEFVDFLMAAERGKLSVLRHMMRRYGLVAGPRRLAALARTLSSPFAGFAHETFHSAAPISCGAYAVRVRLVPVGEHDAPEPRAAQDWGADMLQRLATHGLSYSFEMQPFINETLTPIEDASVDWPSPYTKVARLDIPRQSVDSIQGRRLTADAEQSNQFDPWIALAEHRPLGEVMRARRVVYFASEQGRNAL